MWGFEFLHFAKHDSLIQTFCFAKYGGQTLKTVGDHCFLNALVQIPLYKQKHKKNKHKNVLAFFRVAGVEGFEPPDDGVRVRSLTAWRHPIVDFAKNILTNFSPFINCFACFLLNYKYFFNSSLKVSYLFFASSTHR